MGKRKQATPKFADEAKRQHLHWRMGDQASGNASSGSHTSSFDKANHQTIKQHECWGHDVNTKACPSSEGADGNFSSSWSTMPALALQVDAFYQNLASCSCTLTLYSTEMHKAKDMSCLLEFGNFKLTLVPHQNTTPVPRHLPAFKECWLYISDEKEKGRGEALCMLYFEFEEDSRQEKRESYKKRRRSGCRQTEFGVFWFVTLNVPTALLTDLGNKTFWLGCGEFDSMERSLEVTIYGNNSLILQLSHPSDSVRVKAPQCATQKLMEYFFDIRLPYCPKEQERTTGHDFFQLYEQIMEIQRSRQREDQDWEHEVSAVGHPCLKPRLRPYQRQSVAWMLRQERKGGSEGDGGGDEPHPLYCQVMLPRGISLYYNKYGGSFVRTQPRATPPLPGGILADEMGLGKTVEVLCCMLLHPRPQVDRPTELPVLAEEPEPPSMDNPIITPDSEDLATANGSGSRESASTESQAQSDHQGVLMSGNSSNDLQQSLPSENLDKESSTKLSSTNSHSSDADKDSQIKLKTAEDETARTVSQCVEVGMLEEDSNTEGLIFVKKGQDAPPRLPSPGSRMSSDCNPLLSDTGLPCGKDDDGDVAPLSSSSSQGLIDSDSSYMQSSRQLQPEVVSQPPDSFAVQLEEEGEEQKMGVENEEVQPGSANISTVEEGLHSSSLENSALDTGQFSVTENQCPPEQVSEKQNTTSANSHPGCSPSFSSSKNQPPETEGEPPLSNTPTSSSNPNLQGKKRKSKGYVEYVPLNSESSATSNYFSVKPAGRQQWFECSCGQLEGKEVESTSSKGRLHTVKCAECGMSQHAECMNYDLCDPFRGEYLCPHCHAVCTSIKSGATLIISPYSICHQWIEEIKKHIKERSIKVFIYTGVSKLGYIQPQVLARQDIVITTYDVLRKELDYVNLPHTNSESGRRFRHPKRFLATPSPMVAVEWWRICLDEAQMVECVTTKTAEMALRLKAVNRWCVTGTPLMRSVEDIYGLLLFLNVDPLRVQQWFRQLAWEPFCHGVSGPMHHSLAEVFWRTAKKDVIDQIDLPVQTEEINWLTFSPVEDHFYRRQYEVYLRSVCGYNQRVQHLQDPSMKLHALDRKSLNELMSPLFRLRQACCHPQIVRGEFLPLNKTMMTMEELLEHMTKKVKTECEEAHRLIVASLNGMAGLAIIKDKIPEAVEKYREVLRSVEQNRDQFRTDDLQQLHAMHNLALLLDSKPEGVAPTLRDSQLKEQCEELKTKYMSRTKTNIAASLEGMEASQKAIKDLKMKLDSLDGDWWAEIVDMATQRSIDTDLVFKVKDDLVRTSTNEGTIADIFSTANGLLYVVDQHLQTLATARVALTDQLDTLWRDTSSALVQTAATCCLRPADQVLKTCLFCKVDELFNEYESKLFLFVERGVTVAGDEGNLAYQVSTKRQGTWADSEVERTLKSILAFYRQNFDTDPDILEAAAFHIKHMEALKKEFKTLRSVWLNHREMVSAIDELEMATEKLRLRGEFEPKPTTKILNVIEATDMFGIQASCSRDEIVGRNELRKKLGQLLYLANLAKRAEQGDNCNPDSCPICQSGLGVEWSVLMCGHCFCLGCMRTLIDRTLIGANIDRRLKCPLCRFNTPVREISYVTTLKKDRVSVRGSHSTKVQAVIECLIKIKQQDPTAKALIFSLWVSVLDILASALAENSISYRSLHDPNHFQANLTAFKSDGDLSVLLLPLHVGANGLNLVEANHVLLVEPELNLEEEAQAISRVYRIGQTRQTQIHRFLVRGTIEEKIFHIVKAVRKSKVWGGQPGEEGVELTVGDITSLIQQPGPDELDEDDDVVVGDNGGGNGVRFGSSGSSIGDGNSDSRGGGGDSGSSGDGLGVSGGHDGSSGSGNDGGNAGGSDGSCNDSGGSSVVHCDDISGGGGNVDDDVVGSGSVTDGSFRAGQVATVAGGSQVSDFIVVEVATTDTAGTIPLSHRAECNTNVGESSNASDGTTFEASTHVRNSSSASDGGVIRTGTQGGESSSASDGGVIRTGTHGGESSSASDGGVIRTDTHGGESSSASDGGVIRTDTHVGESSSASDGGVIRTGTHVGESSSASDGGVIRTDTHVGESSSASDGGVIRTGTHVGESSSASDGGVIRTGTHVGESSSASDGGVIRTDTHVGESSSASDGGVVKGGTNVGKHCSAN